ncbi:ATP-grasp domain-containing protein [Bradyrhizobium sp. Ghvi]|uniref:ATP-grasp domain-containing protein n=1 Tax=Bradyrhizobium sp. Ghvi TaxID=1855319 RepID=UPI0008F0ED96|nr:ATP-grasp domain-containing protein [Bradyrhizobium sp. Ghvi]SFP56892.1 ATP-grasp domain-containing protein [Bradyrhizobium sp. Ghvi]
MTCLVIIGTPRTDYTLAQSIIQARLRGMDVILVDRPSQLEGCRELLPDASRIGLDQLDAKGVVEAIGGLNPRFVVSFSEFNLELAAQVRERLDIDGPSVTAVRRTRNKHETRSRLKACELTQVDFQVTTLIELDKVTERFEAPFVIKPVSMTGSIGVHAVRCRAEVAAFKARFVDPAAEEERRRQFVIEGFLEGEEFSIDGIYAAGKFHVFAVVQKRTNGFPNFAEVGHTVPARPRDDVDCGGFVAAVAAALDLDTTPIHAEVKISGRNIELIEIHTRFGGDYIPMLIENAFGYNVFGAYYDVLLGRQLPAVKPVRAVTGIQFLHAGELDRITRLPRAWPGVDYCLRLTRTETHDATLDHDNIRILNHRIGHIVFSAADHDLADAFIDGLYASDDAFVTGRGEVGM